MSLQKARNACKKLIKEDWIFDLAFAIIPKGTEEISFQEGQCFASLRYTEEHKEIDYFIFSQFVGRNSPLNKMEETYLEWLARKSSFRHAFHTKKPKIMRDRGTIMKADFPPQYIFAASLMARYVSEFPDIVKVWDCLKDWIDPNAALVFAHIFIFDREKTCLQAMPTWGSGHKAFSSSQFGKEELNSFMNGDMRDDKFTHMRYNRNYYGNCMVWNDIEPEDRDDTEHSEGETNSAIDIPEDLSTRVRLPTTYGPEKFVNTFPLKTIAKWAPKVLAANLPKKIGKENA